MKALIISLIMIISPYFQQDEVYHVIKVEGTIYIASTNVQLKQGDKIKPTDQLRFASADASALVISNTRGKFTLQMPDDENIFDDSQLFAMADNAVSPVAGRPQLSTRNVFMAEVNKLEDYFGDEDFNIIGDELTIKLNKASYALDDNNYFLLKYKNGEEFVTKKPDVQNNSIILKRNQYLEKSGKLESVEIYQVDKSSGSNEKITTVNLVFLNKMDLEQEFKIIVDILKEQGANKNEINDYLRDYFVDIYGKTDMNSLIILINKISSGS
ncbi:MAG: hypothetical protein JXB49_11450 [Bacteroidales bacterium]|nr:hypothetical protein [Bacteroidales bacterium]